MTRAVFAQAGSEDVCCVCGDTPVHDYDISGTPLRARFCDDCKVKRTIRRGSFDHCDEVVHQKQDTGLDVRVRDLLTREVGIHHQDVRPDRLIDKRTSD
jgi:hypothetical protein